MSSEPSNFSTAFLLSTKELSGIADEFKMRYLIKVTITDYQRLEEPKFNLEFV